MKRTAVNLGCGLKALDGWINVDGSVNAWFANHSWIATLLRPLIGNGWRVWPKGIVRMKLERGLPFATNSIDLIYTSHFIEHLTRHEARTLLKDALRVLKPGGTIRIVVPDLEGAARLYLKSLDSGDAKAAEEFLERTSLYSDSRASFTNLRAWKSFWFDYQRHFWMYDSDSMKHCLSEIGFENVCDCDGQKSEKIADIEQVERAEAVGSDGRGLAVEAQKPQ